MARSSDMPPYHREMTLLAVGYHYVAAEPPLREGAGVVTFDEGLPFQLELALPVLDRLGVPAIFFVAGKPLAEGRALYVHEVHALRERVSDAELLALVDA